MSAEVLQALKAATNGLLYMSETDSPFEISSLGEARHNPLQC